MPETVNDRQRRRDRESAFYLFTQQRLPACKPVLTPARVVEMEERYDIECVPEPFRNDKVSYIQDESIPKNCSLLFKLSDQEDLIVWMRISPLPSFRKLYGRIEEDLDVDDYVTVRLMNNYNTYSFGGKKKLVLSTSNWLGGKNDFLGLAYVFAGSSSLTIAIVFMLLHLRSRGP